MAGQWQLSNWQRISYGMLLPVTYINSLGIIYLTYKYYFTTPNSTQGSVDSA
jgi:hypothetical protein